MDAEQNHPVEMEKPPTLEDVSAYYQVYAEGIQRDILFLYAHSGETTSGNELKYTTMGEIASGEAQKKIDACLALASGIRERNPEALAHAKADFEQEAREKSRLYQQQTEMLAVQTQTRDGLQNMVSTYAQQLEGQLLQGPERAKAERGLAYRQKSLQSMERVVQAIATETEDHRSKAHFFESHLPLLSEQH